MKVLGIVAEFNPFHNGHKALFQHGKRLGASHIVAVMSGNFVQRGEPAITEKRVRAHSALLEGADLVIELPLPYATATAQRFAQGATLLLQQTGVVDGLLFGSESGDIEKLTTLAETLSSSAFTNTLPFFLEEGHPFAVARTLAIKELLGDTYAKLLQQPNNILAIEYLLENRKGPSPLAANTYPRQGADHDSCKAMGGFASASFLRKQKELSALSSYVPSAAYKVYEEAVKDGLYPVNTSLLAASVLSHLRRKSREELACLPDVSEGLDDRLYHAIAESRSLEELFVKTKSKRFTHARVRRLVLSAFLDIKKADASTPPPYLRLLGFTATGRELLEEMKEKASLPFSSRLLDLADTGPEAKRFATLESTATDLYTLLLPTVQPVGYEHTASGIYLL